MSFYSRENDTAPPLTHVCSCHLIEQKKTESPQKLVIPTDSFKNMGVVIAKNDSSDNGLVKNQLIDHNYTVTPHNNDVIALNSIDLVLETEKGDFSKIKSNVQHLCRVCLEPSENLKPLVYSTYFTAYKKLTLTTVS